MSAGSQPGNWGSVVASHGILFKCDGAGLDRNEGLHMQVTELCAEARNRGWLTLHAELDCG